VSISVPTYLPKAETLRYRQKGLIIQLQKRWRLAIISSFFQSASGWMINTLMGFNSARMRNKSSFPCQKIGHGKHSKGSRVYKYDNI